MKRRVLLIGVLSISGCLQESSTEESADLVPVAGVVTLDGAPLAGASVRFLPTEESSAGGSYFAATNADGEFELQSRTMKSGAEVGDYLVVISKFAMEDGTPIADDADPGDVALGMEHLPPRYSEQSETELRASVPVDGKTDFEFPLTSD